MKKELINEEAMRIANLFKKQSQFDNDTSCECYQAAMMMAEYFTQQRFYEELCKLDGKDKIFSVTFWKNGKSASEKSTISKKKAALYFNDIEFDYFVIDFCEGQFVLLNDLESLVEYNKKRKIY